MTAAEPHRLVLEHEKLRLLIYGMYGIGKTTLAGTFPKPLVIDTNGGLVVLALDGTVVDRFEPTGYRDLEALYFWIKERADDYETIVIDTLDSLVFELMDEITEDAVEAKKADRKPVTLRMEFVPEQGDYFANQRQMKRFLNDLRRLGKHIVITSGARDKKARSTPDVSDGMEKVVCDWASVIGELILVDEAGESEPDEAGTAVYDGCRALLTSTSNRRATKSRFKSLVPYVIDPTFDTIAGLIEAEFAAKTAPAKTTTTTTTRKTKTKEQ